MPMRCLRGSTARLGLTVTALALGVALVCAIDLVNGAVLRSFTDLIDTMAGRAALQVTAGADGLFSEDVAATVAGIPGVELAVPLVSATAFLADDSGELLSVHGIDITNEGAVRVYDAHDAGGLDIDDPLVLLNQPRSLLLTRSFAAQHHLEIGAEVPLITPTGRRAFTVRGLLEPQGVARVYGGNLAAMDLYAAEAAFTRPGFINRVDVVVDRAADVAQVSAAIAAALPKGFGVEAPLQRKADLHKVMRSLQTVLQGFGLVGLVAGFLIAFNRLTTVFERRVWQLGVMHAIGLRSRTLWRCLAQESLLLGSAGVAIGIPLGIGIGRLLLPGIATTTALAYNLIAPEGALEISAHAIVLSATLGLSAALLAAALPAWRAARVEIADTIRSRGVELTPGGGPAAWLVRGAALVAVAAAILMQSATQSPLWGLVATVLIAATAALGARPLMHVGLALARPSLRRFTAPSSRFASCALLHNPRRVSLMAATLGVGLGAVVWLRILACSFEHSVIEMMSGFVRADLMVSSAHMGAGFLAAPIDGELVDHLRRTSGVTTVAAQRLVDWRYRGGAIGIHALDPNYLTDPGFGTFSQLGGSRDGVWTEVARGTAVAISSNMALNMGLDVGQSITLETPRGPLTLPIAGRTTDFASPRGTIEMSRETYREYWQDNQVTDIAVQTAPGATESVRGAITRQWGQYYGLRILSSGEFIDFYAHQVRRAFAALELLTAMVLTVVLVGLADTLSAGVAERSRDLGSMRALGVRRRYLRRIVLLEGLFLGAVGLLLALTAGLALGRLWVDATFPYLLGWTITYYVPYIQVARMALISTAVCLAAGLLPASRAARLEPAVALRYE
jgi:putative ABC transport system permease protein